MPNSAPKIWALIPAYNNEKTVRNVIEATVPLVSGVLVVDDGSTDNTLAEIKKTAAHVIVHEFNRGKGAALRTGFDTLKKEPDIDAVITLDADAQHDPAEIPKFIERFKTKNADLILGTRKVDRKNMPLLRLIGNLGNSWLIGLFTGQKFQDTQAGFRLFSKNFLTSLDLVSKRYEIEAEMIIKAANRGLKIDIVPIKNIYPPDNKFALPIKDVWRNFLSILKFGFRKKLAKQKSMRYNA